MITLLIGVVILIAVAAVTRLLIPKPSPPEIDAAGMRWTRS